MPNFPIPVPIERLDSLTPEDFRKNYDLPGKPLIIMNGLDWPAFEKWTHLWFRNSFGHFDIDLSVNPTHTAKVVKMKLGIYVDKILSDKGMGGGLYLDQFPLSRIPELSKDFYVPPYCNKERQVMTHLWIGPGTTVLSFHKDNQNALTPINNIFVQIRGQKRVILASPENDDLMYPRSPEEGAQWHSHVDPEKPDLTRFPKFAQASLQEAVLGPRDILFIPRDYWHYVRALEPSISMSFWWIPSRLSEIFSQLITKDESEFEQLRAKGESSVTCVDIAEFGGLNRLEKMMSSLKDKTLYTVIWNRLLALADEDAQITLRTICDV